MRNSAIFLLRRDWGFKQIREGLPPKLHSLAVRHAVRIAFQSSYDPHMRCLLARHVYLILWCRVCAHRYNRFWAHALYLNDGNFIQTVGWLRKSSFTVYRQYVRAYTHLRKLSDQAARKIDRYEAQILKKTGVNPIQLVDSSSNPQTRSVSDRSLPEASARAKTRAAAAGATSPLPQTQSVSDRSLPEASTRLHTLPRPPPPKKFRQRHHLNH